ncbi:MAG: dockerin type I repeat-containing protein, partial [Oscillospiraceae bacterium]|nr:dockerin type I repeat-containing protein [Oscillospiraceae bacterium]
MKKIAQICRSFGMIILGLLVAILAVAAVLVSAESVAEQDHRGKVAGNDTVGIVDARLVLQHIVGKITLTPEQLPRADVNGDDMITVADARLILQFVVGRITAFPALPGETETTTEPTGPTDPVEPRPLKENTIPIVQSKANDDEKYQGRPYEDGDPWTDNEALNQGMFGRFLLRQEENPHLPYNVTCYVSKTRREISALLPAGVDISSLVPVFTVKDGAAVTITGGDENGKPVISGETALDCRKKFSVAILNGGETIEMTIRIWTYNEDHRLQGKAFIQEPGNDSDALNQGMFGKFLLRQEENPQLPFNVECFINKSCREISALLPAGVDISLLVPIFTVPPGAAVTFNGKPVISGVTALDFYDLFKLSVQSGGNTVAMTVRVETLYTGLPSISLNTDDLGTINSRTVYQPITF